MKYPFRVTNDLKLLGENGAGPAPLWSYIAHYRATPSAKSATAIKAATNLGTAAATATASLGAIDVARNASIKGNASGINGTVTLYGKRGTASISETIVANGTAVVVGNKAFDLIGTVVFPPYTNGTADTISVGVDNKLGIPHKRSLDTTLFAYYNGTKEGTPPTVANNATAVESNTITLNTTLAGSVVDYYYLVN